MLATARDPMFFTGRDLRGPEFYAEHEQVQFESLARRRRLNRPAGERLEIGRPMTELIDNWRKVLDAGKPARGRAIDGVSRWLLITRAGVFSMTITSGLIGGLLAAATAPDPNWGYFALALLGLVVAHAANNMINDYFDTTGGVDTAQYTRALYAPHPLLSGLITQGRPHRGDRARATCSTSRS